MSWRARSSRSWARRSRRIERFLRSNIRSINTERPSHGAAAFLFVVNAVGNYRAPGVVAPLVPPVALPPLVVPVPEVPDEPVPLAPLPLMPLAPEPLVPVPPVLLPLTPVPLAPVPLAPDPLVPVPPVLEPAAPDPLVPVPLASGATVPLAPVAPSPVLLPELAPAVPLPVPVPDVPEPDVRLPVVPVPLSALSPHPMKATEPMARAAAANKACDFMADLDEVARHSTRRHVVAPAGGWERPVQTRVRNQTRSEKTEGGVTRTICSVARTRPHPAAFPGRRERCLSCDPVSLSRQ